jgi:hypothetical protein
MQVVVGGSSQHNGDGLVGALILATTTIPLATAQGAALFRLESTSQE